MILRIFITVVFFTAFLFAQNNGLLNKFALAQSYENSGDLEKASKIYEELYQLEPQNNLYFESLNRTYVQLKNYAASVNLIEQEIAIKPNDINLYGLLGSTYYLMGNEEKAYQVWDEPFSFLEPNSVFYRVIAAYAVERRAFDKAIDLFRRGKEISTDKIIFSYDLARLYSLTMQYENAAEEYCTILSNDPLQLQNVQTKILANVNKPGALIVTIPVVEQYLDEDNLSFSFLLARLYIENKDFDKAFEMYVNIDEKQSQKGIELYRYAVFLFREGEYEISKNVYQSIIKLYPGSPLIPSVKLGYAKSLEAILMEDYSDQIPLWKPYFAFKPYEAEQVEEVIDAFNEVAALYNNSEASYEALLRIGMIKFYLQNKRDEAKQYFNKIINKAIISASTADAYSELGEIDLINGNLAEAEKNYSKITVLAGINQHKINNAKYKLARVKFYNGDVEAAQKLLADILKNLKDDNANDALSLSLLLNTSKNDSVNIMLFAEAEFLADQKKFSKAAKKYELIAENPQAFILHSIASIRLAEMELALNNYPRSIGLFERVVEEGEKNIYADKALYLLAQIFQYGIGDNAKAIEMYEMLLAKFPASIYIDKARNEIRKLREKIS
ncbi:MAG: tetratricopeptide repeat protein [Bacteroidetes bacterium]|nr:tetratricopeptide repeat protein [Bacteroidota bacterium]